LVCWGCWGQTAAAAAAAAERIQDLEYIHEILDSCLNILTDLGIGNIPTSGLAEQYRLHVKVSPVFLQHCSHCYLSAAVLTLSAAPFPAPYSLSFVGKGAVVAVAAAAVVAVALLSNFHVS
jgi:hypothetical protein